MKLLYNLILVIVILLGLTGTAIAMEESILVTVMYLIKEAIPFIILIIGSYIGAFLASLLIKEERSESVISTILLYGSVGWLAILLAENFRVLSLVELGMVISFIIFVLSGAFFYLVFTVLDRSRD